MPATITTPRNSGGLISSWATIRHSVRSASTCVPWRQIEPVGRPEDGNGGTCASRKWLAARRSSRTSRRHSDRGDDDEREADADDAQRGADEQQQDGRDREDGDRQRRREIADGLAGVEQPAVELERVDHRRPSTTTSPDVLSAWMENGASDVAVTPRTTLRPEALSASTW